MNCARCGQPTTKTAAKLRGLVEHGQQAYCSRACRGNTREFMCDACGKTFAIRPSQRAGEHVYCSDDCGHLTQRATWTWLPPYTGGGYTVRLRLVTIDAHVEWQVQSERDRLGLQMALGREDFGPCEVEEAMVPK